MSVLLSIVVPVYNEEKSIPEFLKQLMPILQKICSNFEIIFVVDPSTDSTEQLVVQAAQQDGRIKLITLSRRFGQPRATLAGLHFPLATQ